jgi:hypothetical protein
MTYYRRPLAIPSSGVESAAKTLDGSEVFWRVAVPSSLPTGANDITSFLPSITRLHAFYGGCTYASASETRPFPGISPANLAFNQRGQVLVGGTTFRIQVGSGWVDPFLLTNGVLTLEFTP